MRIVNLFCWGLLVLLFSSICARAQTAAPVGAIVVAVDGSGTYKTVQEAVEAVPSQSRTLTTIFIKKGTYREKLVISKLKINLRLLGEDKDQTILTYDDHSGANGINTFTSHSVIVQANDFTAENLTFSNTAGRTAGQAVALHVEGDRCVFKNCRIVGDQDTLYLADDHCRQYFRDCYIEGTTDFIFGSATAVFDRCTVQSKKNSFVTAASTSPTQPFGFVFLDCKLTADTTLAKKVFLGRPWRPNARVVYVRCELGGHIVPEGWANWKNTENDKTAYYAEYKSSGPGANPAARVAWSHQLTAKEAKQYTVKNIFGAQGAWNPTK